MIYIAEWEKNTEKTWSGTTKSLRRSLAKYEYIDDIVLKVPGKVEKFKYISKNLLKNKQIEKNMNFNIEYQNQRNNFVLKQYNKIDDKYKKNIIQIGDIANIEDSYIYQDLSISFLLNEKNNHPDLFKMSGFDRITERQWLERLEIQEQRYREAKAILTMSKTLKDYLVNKDGFSKGKVFHVGGGINLSSEIQQISTNKKRNKILFIGRDFYRKGGDKVVGAFKLLQERGFDDLELHIAGPKRIDDKYFGSNIYFHGDINKNKLEKLFLKCDLFCMPSVFEAYGLVYIEALSYGLPCIAHNMYEMKHFIKHGYNGVLINDIFSIEKIAETIIYTLNSDFIFSNVEMEREKYLHEYSWDTVAERVKKLINGQ